MALTRIKTDQITDGEVKSADLDTDITLTGDLNVADITMTGELNGPATFYIDPSPHDPDTDGATNGLVVIRGDLQVDGTTTTVNSTTMDVADLNITLASGAANAAAADGAGLTVDGASATLLYQSVGDKFAFNKSIDISGSITSTGTIKSDSAFGGFITLKRSDTTTTNNSDIGAINFEHTDSDDAGVAATILASGDGDAGGAKLRFLTGTPTSRPERLTILSNGNVGIGTDDPTVTLHAVTCSFWCNFSCSIPGCQRR